MLSSEIVFGGNIGAVVRSKLSAIVARGGVVKAMINSWTGESNEIGEIVSWGIFQMRSRLGWGERDM